MTDRIIRPRLWVGLLALVSVIAGVAALAVLPNPFSAGTADPRGMRAMLLAWVLAGALSAAGGFRLLAWRSLRLDESAIETRSMFGRRSHVWSDLKYAERLPRVLKLTFKSGIVRVISNHYASADIAALEQLAKMATKKTA